MNKLNYAKVYSDALAQAFPYALNFGALYATENNGRYRFKGGKYIEIPRISTTSRSNSDRDTVDPLTRNYENSWQSEELGNERKWSTLIHPADVDETNYAATISNITSVFNNEHKFPEMDAYTVSKIYNDWFNIGNSPVITEVTAENVLTLFDEMMAQMTENRVPESGRILYVTPKVMKILKSCSAIGRSLDVKNVNGEINRTVTMLDGVSVVTVPSSLMKSSYIFDNNGWHVADSCYQINMFLIHPESVITPVTYEFACLDQPSAATGGKYVYYEESHEDVFILDNRASGISFVVEPSAD